MNGQKYVIIIYVVLLINTCVKEGNSRHYNCVSNSCRKFANVLKDTINEQINPCSDFFQHVCDGWTKRNGNYVSRYDEQSKDVKSNMIDMLKKGQPNDSESIKKGKRIYQMCIGNLGDSGRSELKSFLRDTGGWPLITFPYDPWPSAAQWQVISKRIDRYNVSGAFYNIEVVVDPETRTKRIKVQQPQHINNLTSRHILLNVIEYLMKDDNNMMHFLESNENRLEVHDDVTRTIDLAVNLRNIRTSNKTTVKMTIKEFQQEYDSCASLNASYSQIDWFNIIQSKYQAEGLTDSEVIFVEGLPYFTKLRGVLSNLARPYVTVNYLMWMFTYQLMKYVSNKTREIVGFPEVTVSRNWACLEEPNLKHALYYAHVKELYTDNSLQHAHKVADNVKFQLINQIWESKWMGNTTKYLAADDLSSLKVKIGVPDWYNDIGIDNYYKNIGVESSYFKSVLNILKFEIFVDGEQLKIQDNFTSGVLPIDVISHYDRVFDTVVVPAVASNLSYVWGAIPAVNYGLLGSMIAQDMVRAYDMERVYHKDVGYLAAWSNEDIEQYKQKTRCLAENYTNQDVETLSTMIADTGVLAAFRAYKTYTNDTDETRLLTLQKYTADQLFFISYALARCEKDTHTFPTLRTRVQLSLSNMDEFATTFNCAVGTPMNPSHKCKLWD